MKVLIVDDEPFIAKGLCVLIDWAAEGYEIVGLAANGEEALNHIKTEPVDLIIADIQMPVMTGLELLETIRKEAISDAHFIILSGYKDFRYAQTAIRYACMDYVLKPVGREELLKSLRRVSRKQEQIELETENSEQMQQAYLYHNLTALIHGNYKPENLEYVQKNMPVLGLAGGARYIHIHFKDCLFLEEMDDEEVNCLRSMVYERCRAFLKEDAPLCIKDIPGTGDGYEVGFVYCEGMARKRGMQTKEFLRQLLDYMNEDQDILSVLLVGKQVEDVSKLCHSYTTACMLRSFQGFRAPRDIYYYEKEVQNNPSDGVILCKESLDKLIQAVGNNDRVEINKSVDSLFNEMERMGMVSGSITMNTNYLLFRLIYLAVEQEETVNQEEVMRYIGENSFDTGIVRGSRAHLRKFACDYAEYLIQLRRNVSRGILLEIETEVRENYAKNLTLREFSQRYYVNSSYLGQIFRKKYGQSFKDYLCRYRIEKAASALIHSSKKVSQIAEEVGYKDVDYFISKFISIKGCTPSKYRKQPDMN